MDIRDLIGLLSDGAFHSGEQLGERLGVSRTAIWKQLKKLESMGVEIEAIRGQGYRIAPRMELLEGASIVSHLGSDSRRLLSRLFVETVSDSTNDFILRRFAQGAGHGEVCFAETQTQSRGRRGRKWSAGFAQGLCFSIGWRFDCPAARLEGLSLAIGTVIAEALSSLGVDVGLKWPNDLLLRQGNSFAKLGGILVELKGDAEGPCDVVVGIGINVMSTPTLNELPQPTAALLSVLPSVSRNEVASRILARLLPMFAQFQQEGFAPWCQQWNAFHAFRDTPVDIIQGGQALNGIAGDVDEHGSLGIWVGAELHRFSGGEISLRPRI